MELVVVPRKMGEEETQEIDWSTRKGQDAMNIFRKEEVLVVYSGWCGLGATKLDRANDLKCD